MRLDRVRTQFCWLGETTCSYNYWQPHVPWCMWTTFSASSTFRGRARIVQAQDEHAIESSCNSSSHNVMMDRSKGYMYVNKRSRDDSISKIENFLRFFMQGIQDIPLTGKPLSVSMGAPRSKDQLARVQWEFPSKRDKNMKQWGTRRRRTKT